MDFTDFFLFSVISFLTKREGAYQQFNNSNKHDLKEEKSFGDKNLLKLLLANGTSSYSEKNLAFAFSGILQTGENTS